MTGRSIWTVRKARTRLRRAIRRVRLTLRPNTNGVGLRHKILVGTHHKTGTVWMGQIFRKICWEFGLEYFSGRQEDLPPGFDVFFQDHSGFDLTRIQGEYRGLHVIRDPRDVIVSGCFYHQRAAEKWLHVRREEFGGFSYQERLNSFPSLDEQLIFEMQHSRTIRDMLAWSYSNPNIFEARYEDLILDRNLMQFHRIFDFLGFPGEMIPQALKIAYESSLFSGKVRTSSHVRSGDGGQWRKYFKPEHKAKFCELFGDALTRLGYEADDAWVRN